MRIPLHDLGSDWTPSTDECVRVSVLALDGSDPAIELGPDGVPCTFLAVWPRSAGRLDRARIEAGDVPVRRWRLSPEAVEGLRRLSALGWRLDKIDLDIRVVDGAVRLAPLPQRLADGPALAWLDLPGRLHRARAECARRAA